MHARARIVFGLTLAVLASAFAVPAATVGDAADDAATEPSLTLRWALGAIDPTGGEPSAVRRDTQLGSGSRLKFLVEPLSPCSVYLILLTSAEEVEVLHRERPKTNGKAADGAPTYIPSDPHWFELDDQAGVETFFLLAATEPLADLEQLLDAHGAAEGPARKALGPKIIEEIRKLHRAHRQFSRPVEKPVMIGGRTRGADAASIDNLAVEITAERFYDKTITIDH
jgi:hypothetical protein